LLPNTPNAGAYTPSEVRHSQVWIAAAWVPGSAFFAITTGVVFNSFLKKALQVGDLGYGLIMAAGPAAVLFLVLGSLAVERTGRSKRRFMQFVLAHRLIWFGVAAVPYIFTNLPNRWATGVVGILVFLAASAANFGNSGWSVWMSAIIPKGAAGKFFGFRSSLGLVTMCLSSWVAARIIGGDPTDAKLYTWIFVAAALLGATDILCFTSVPERPRPVPESKPSLWGILSVPWGNGVFRSVAVYCFVAWFAYNMIGPFMWLFCLEKTKGANGLGLTPEVTNWFLAILPLLSMALMSPFWGRAIDRFGPKPVLGVGSVVALIAPLFFLIVHHGVSTTVTLGPWTFEPDQIFLVPTVTLGPWTLKPDLIWLVPVVQFISGLTWAAIEQSIFYVQLKSFPEDKRSAYIASFQVVLLVGSMLGVAFAGVCATFWQEQKQLMALLFPAWFSHYQPVFLMSILLRIAAFVFLFPRLRLEGTAQYRDVARSVASEARSAVPKLKRRTKR
jgi:MFS family permease